LILCKNFRGITFFASNPSTPLKYFSCTFSTSSRSFHPKISAPYINILFVMLSNIIILLLKSPLHFLSPILHTLLTISLICALFLALSLDVTQVFELVYLFYFPFFLVTLILNNNNNNNKMLYLPYGLSDS
jgi:energy-converting hydrogenase Eha subunit C